MYGYEQSKNIVRQEHDLSSISKNMDKGGSSTGQNDLGGKKKFEKTTAHYNTFLQHCS